MEKGKTIQEGIWGKSLNFRIEQPIFSAYLRLLTSKYDFQR